MKRLNNQIDQFFYRYKKLTRMIDHEVTIKNTLKSVLGALIFSLVILALPVLVLINLFIISKLTLLLSILIAICVIAWPYLYYTFYYKLIKIYHPKVNDINTKIPYWTESTIISVVLCIVGIIVLTIIF